MSSQVRRSLALALAGLVGGLGLVLALFGGGDALRRMAVRHETEAPAAAAPRPDAGARSLAGPDARDRGTAEAGPPSGPSSAADASKAAAGPDPVAPSFDIVRVEPNGDTVVAGRGAPNTVVEMLVDGKPVARALTDPNGQFAIVPPALPVGSSEIRLRTKAADGRESRSAQSVAVDVAQNRDRKPLVALTAPDRPTVVLSQPDAPEPGGSADRPAGARQAEAGRPDAQPPGAKPSRATSSGANPAGAKPSGKVAAGRAQPARIVSVDAQEGGRLYVTATGTPGADLRLYLNDTLIAPGRAGPDGRVTFTIGRGVKPGQYQVRIDQLEPGTARVRHRAEVPFTVPEPARVAARDPQPPARPNGAEGTGGQASGGTGPGTPPAAGAPRTGSTTNAAMPPAPDPSTAAVFVPEIGTARISRGDNLWRISQRTYGRGERYTVIYDANQQQIRDPDLIYPGQIFVLPADKRG